MMVLPTPSMTTPDAIAAVLSELGPNAAGERT
jgi:hypothetical protein